MNVAAAIDRDGACTPALALSPPTLSIAVMSSPSPVEPFSPFYPVHPNLHIHPCEAAMSFGSERGSNEPGVGVMWMMFLCSILMMIWGIL
jgi:hypothetical protein